MAQTRRHSVIETSTNTAIGFVGSWAITYLVIVNVADKGAAALVGVVLCTIWSLVRGYAVRRYFAGKEQANG